MGLKVLLCGEGKNDFGIDDGFGVWKEGAAQDYIRNALNGEVEEIKAVPKSEIKQFHIFKGKYKDAGKLEGHGILANKFALYSINLKKQQKQDYDILIYYADADKEQGKSSGGIEAERRFELVHSQISDAFSKLSEINGVPMVPLRMIESWLLGDSNSYRSCFGRIPSKPQLPEQSEYIWGDEGDASSNHPKCYLRRVLRQFQQESCTEIFKQVARESAAKTLCRNCSVSYARFYTDLRNAKNRCCTG